MAYIDNEESPFVSSFEHYSFFPTEEKSIFLNEKHVYIENNQYDKITNCFEWNKTSDKVKPTSPHAIETLYVPVADARDFDFIVMVTDITYFCTGTSVFVMLCYYLFKDIRRDYMRYRETWLLKRAREMELKDKESAPAPPWIPAPVRVAVLVLEKARESPPTPPETVVSLEMTIVPVAEVIRSSPTPPKIVD